MGHPSGWKEAREQQVAWALSGAAPGSGSASQPEAVGFCRLSSSPCRCPEGSAPARCRVVHFTALAVTFPLPSFLSQVVFVVDRSSGGGPPAFSHVDCIAPLRFCRVLLAVRGPQLDSGRGHTPHCPRSLSPRQRPTFSFPLLRVPGRPSASPPHEGHGQQPGPGSVACRLNRAGPRAADLLCRLRSPHGRACAVLTRHPLSRGVSRPLVAVRWELPSAPCPVPAVWP